MNLYLGIDSATPYLSLSLCTEEKVLANFCERLERSHAKHIIPEIDKLFISTQTTKSNLAAIGVGLGPGSYTGLRIGIAVAKGIARALQIPLYGTSTLEAIAAPHLNDKTPQALAILEAYRGNVYVGHYEWSEGAIQQINIEKIARADLKGYTQIPFIENTPPDAGYLARKSVRQTSLPSQVLEPFYL